MEGRWPSIRSFEEPPYPETSVTRVSMSPEEVEALVMVDAKNKFLLESHTPPIVWARHQHGFRIEDMTSKQYLDVNNIIMKYMPSDPLLKTIESPEAVDLYSSTLMTWYPKTQSLVALKEGSKEVIGVLVGRLVVEDNWFKLLSEIEFVTKKDKYAYLKQGPNKDATGPTKATKAMKAGKQRKSMKRGSRVAAKRQSKAGGGRKSMGAKGGGQRKSMGAKGGGQRKSMGAKSGGQRKSMGAKGGQRKSMGAKGGQRKSMGAKGGQRKSMGAKGGQRKSMGGKGGQRKSMGGKSVGSQKKSMVGKGRAERKLKGDTKVPRPEDIIPEEVFPIVQAEIFDDDQVVFSNDELQYVQTFKRKLAERFKVWMLLTQKMYYRVYLVAVSSRYERFDIEGALFASLRNMCFAFNINAVAGILTKYSAQNAFYNNGGLMVYEILYKHYPKFEPSDPRSYDRSVAVMFMELPPPPPPVPAEPAPPAPEIKPKKTKDK
ncbi:hypothetical protein GE061_008022 [Apolygus lucorum]|uniref:Uncharacterized protein n=1 Tax=Apolygus lucorum TaxID=248454 RepID=A0A6A4J169_APOLU|nr:hypothetical protein GE061_008022 [Apolygus lucorum]